MIELGLLALGVLLAAAAAAVSGQFWSFAAQRPEDYADETPAFDIRTALAGAYLCEGLFFDFTGRVRARFRADMEGVFTSRGGTLKEEFRYSDGAAQLRHWTITVADDGRVTATAPDIVGQALGVQSGNTLRMRYRLRLAKSAGGHVVDVTDWMYLTQDGAILNRAQMRKFGLKVGEMFAVLKHRAPSPEAANAR